MAIGEQNNIFALQVTEVRLHCDHSEIQLTSLNHGGRVVRSSRSSRLSPGKHDRINGMICASTWGGDRGMTPIRIVPRSESCMVWAVAMIWSTFAATRRASSITRTPAAVAITPLDVRSNRATPMDGFGTNSNANYASLNHQ